MEFRWIEWNRDKLAAHGVTESEAEHVVEHARSPYPRWREDDKLLVWGAAETGRLLQVVYLLDSDNTVFVIHARPLTDGEKRQRRRAQRRRGKS
ncbi:MAG: hypothetical protein WCK89_25875 [bacterium]